MKDNRYNSSEELCGHFCWTGRQSVERSGCSSEHKELIQPLMVNWTEVKWERRWPPQWPFSLEPLPGAQPYEWPRCQRLIGTTQLNPPDTWGYLASTEMNGPEGLLASAFVFFTHQQCKHRKNGVSTGLLLISPHAASSNKKHWSKAKSIEGILLLTRKSVLLPNNSALVRL